MRAAAQGIVDYLILGVDGARASRRGPYARLIAVYDVVAGKVMFNHNERYTEINNEQWSE